MNNGKNGQGTHCTKVGADKLADHTTNAPKFIYQNRLSKPKLWDFDEKRLHWSFVVRDHTQRQQHYVLMLVRVRSIFESQRPNVSIYNPITAMGFLAMFTFALDNTKR